MGQNPYSINFPKGIKMLNTLKNIKNTNADKNKLNSVKPLIKNKAQSKLNHKIEFHRSLEAFSDCI